jgi:hypothetical protein
MALKQLFTNNAVSLLAAPLSIDATVITVLSGHGEKFPTPQANEFFVVTLEDQSATAQEIVYVTARSGDTFTVVRGQEGTSARAWSASSGSDTLVDHRITAESLLRLGNQYQHNGFPLLTDFKEAIDYLLQTNGSGEGGGTTTVVDAAVQTSVQPNGTHTLVQTPSAFVPGSTAVYIGGVRQKRGVDFIETGATTLELQFALSPEQIADGLNVVVDYALA